jgi:hypothetical protein
MKHARQHAIAAAFSQARTPSSKSSACRRRHRDRARQTGSLRAGAGEDARGQVPFDALPRERRAGLSASVQNSTQILPAIAEGPWHFG